MTLSLDSMVLRQMIMDHYENPRNHQLVNDDRYDFINMDSQTCIDNIDIQVLFDGDIIKDFRFDGEACAIATASTSMLSELVIDKPILEVKNIIENFMNMIYEREYDDEVLEEAIAFMYTYKQANRIKCATIGWNGLEKIIAKKEG